MASVCLVINGCIIIKVILITGNNRECYFLFYQSIRAFNYQEKTMSTIYTGSTNTTGTGSATGLTAENAFLAVFSGDWILTEESVFVSDLGNDVIATNQGKWNQAGYKEISIETDKNFIFIDNFVDVDVLATSNRGTDVTVLDAKRGDIATGNGRDVVEISAYSNASSATGWGNMFNVDTGAGSDIIQMTHSKNSQWTEFNIDAGRGHDFVDVSELYDPVSGVSRFADGGRGVDFLKFSGDNTLEFENFEVVIGGDSAALELDEDLLESNDSLAALNIGLVLSNINLSTDLAFETNEGLSVQEVLLLEASGFDSTEFTSVTLMGEGDSEYTVLTDSDDFAIV